MRHYLLVIALLISIVSTAQHRRKERNPVFHEISNKEVVQSVFADAMKVEKVNDYSFKIVDNKNKVKGFALTSELVCKDIMGYNNTTPVMIITDKNKVIKKVSILSNYETLSYVNKLNNSGFFNSWNNFKLKDAKKVEPDGYTGATITAKAVKKNIDFLLDITTKK